MTEPIIHIDFETRSTQDLKEVGLWNYARHLDTDVWCCAIACGDADPVLWAPINGAGNIWYGPTFSQKIVYAHNAPFELAIWNNIMVPRYGWPELKVEQTFCTMAMAYAMGLPGALADAALATGIDMRKDAEGHALMLRMSRPRSVKGGKIVWWDEPEKLARLYEYCRQDVRVERDLHKRLMPLSDAERRVWLLDYKINQRGVAIDVETAKAAVDLAEKMKGKYDEQIAQATGGAATTCTALGPIKQWLAENGCPEAKDGLAKQDVIDFLDRPDLSPAARQVLTLRQEAGRASTAKFGKMLSTVGDDGRLHNLYQYHGAGTGRWAGRGVQVHNLVRDMPKAEAVENILALIRAGDDDTIDAIYGAPLAMAARCMRSFFVAPPGKVLVSGDFANVEGRGQAWFAGEHWKIAAFIAADNKTGPGLYELAYSRMFGVPVESVKNPSEERQIGKVAELAFGYQGGAGSFHTMGKNYNVKVTDAKANEFKDAWRQAHPEIVKTWYAIQDAAIRAVKNPGETFTCGFPGRQAKFKKAGSFLWCLLPSGRAICYPYPKILEGKFGPQLTYVTVPDPAKPGKIIYDPQNAGNWARIGTYGGSLFNNIVQGMARDLLAYVMIQLEAQGAAIVLHTHDEVAIEVAEEKAERARHAMRGLMCGAPAWAAGFPLFTEPQSMRRYGKG